MFKLSTVRGPYSMHSVCILTLLCVTLSACGSGSGSEAQDSQPPSPQAALPTIDTSSSAIRLLPGNDYQMRVRPLQADGGLGPWSDDMPLTAIDTATAISQNLTTGLLADAPSPASDEPSALPRISWNAQDGADAWEIMIIRISDGSPVAHRTIDKSELCDDEGLCAVEPVLTDSVTASLPAPTAQVLPDRGVAPLNVMLNAIDVSDGDIVGVDWLISGSTDDLPEQQSVAWTFEQPGEYEISLLSIDRHGFESISTATVIVTDDQDTIPAASLTPVATAFTVPELKALPPTKSPTVVGSPTIPTADSSKAAATAGQSLLTITTSNQSQSPIIASKPVPVASTTPDIATNANNLTEKNTGPKTSVDTTTSVTASPKVPVTKESSTSPVPAAETNATASKEVVKATVPPTSTSPFAAIDTDNTTLSPPPAEKAPITPIAEKTPINQSTDQTVEQPAALAQPDNEKPGTSTTEQSTIETTQASVISEIPDSSGDQTDADTIPEVTQGADVDNQSTDVMMTENTSDSETVSQTGPVINNISVGQITDKQATIIWYLDRNATGVVEYGTSSSLGSWTQEEKSLKWNYHYQVITGLQANTEYYFRVHSTDENGLASVSEQEAFTTLEAEPGLQAALPTSGSTDQTNSDYNNDLPYGGLFYGNPTGGVHAANARIAEVSSRRFRAERSGLVDGVRYHNRILLQANIDYRCDIWGDDPSRSKGQWCKCKNAGLDPVSCSYTLGSSYHVGNGGLITIEIRPDNGDGLPSNTVLGKTNAYVPYDLPHNGYPQIKLIDPVQLTAGNIYHLVYTNARPPINCALSHVAVSDAGKCDRTRGAIGLNGVFYPHSSTTSGNKGPWYGTDSAANLYQSKAGGSWTVYPGNLSWFELAYTDGVNVGDTYTALNVTQNSVTRTIGGSTRARQRFTVRDLSRRVDGVWVNFGHTSSTNGSSMSVTLKNDSGSVLANGTIAASSQCRELAKKSGWDRHCRDWGYASFDKTISLLEGSSYSVEFNASTGAGFTLTTVEPLSIYHDFQDRNNWKDARGEISTNNGSSWGQWSDRLGDERDMTVLFTIEGMPKQMP